MREQIAIGRVRKPHGVKGYLKVMSFSGEYEHFFTLEGVCLKKDGVTVTRQVEKVVPQQGQILIKLAGIDNPEEGKALNGWKIWVPREMAVNKEPDEYYHADLEGCHILLNGRNVGRVLGVLSAGADDLLEVDTGQENKLIPFNASFIGSVDVEKGRIELLEGWILD